MSTDETRVATSGHHFLRVLLILLALLLVLSVVATVTVIDSAAAENGSASDNTTFESFAVEFDAADPERSNDVHIRWNLSTNATDVETVRIAIRNESGESINLYTHRGPDVPNSFTVAETGSAATADLHVSDLSTVELQLKVPPGHCERVDTVQVFVANATGNETANITSADPAIERSVHCGKGTPGQFAVTIDDYDETVRVGGNATVNATVRNAGDRETTQSVRFLVDGVVRDRVNLTLGADETEQVQFAVEPTAAEVGELSVAVESDDDRANRTITVLEAPRPTFSVAIGTTTAPVAAGETLTVTAQVENTGNVSGTQTIELSDFGGKTVDVAENVSLSPGESTTVSLNWSTNDPDTGTDNVTVHSENDTANASVTVTTATVDSVTVTLEDSVITTAENTSVVVEATYTKGTTRTITDDAAINVTNETVATVVNDTVVGRNPGSTHVVASLANETDAEQLTVQSTDSGDSDGDGTGDSTDSDDGSQTDDSTDTGGSDETDASTGTDEPEDTDESASEDASSGENLTNTNESAGNDLAGDDDAGDVGNEDSQAEPISDGEDDEDGSPELPEDGPMPIHDEPNPDDDSPDWPSDGPELTSEPDIASTEDGTVDATGEGTPRAGGAVNDPAERRIAFLPLLLVLFVPILIKARWSWT